MRGWAASAGVVRKQSQLNIVIIEGVYIFIVSFRSRRESTLCQGVGEGFLESLVFELDMSVGVWERAGHFRQRGNAKSTDSF